MKIHQESLTDVVRYLNNHQELRLEDYRKHQQAIFRIIERFKPLTKDMQLIEIGTGTGWFPMLCQLDGWKCRGLEISPQLIEYAKQCGEIYGIEPDIQLGNVEEIDLGREVYDVIVASSVFEHIEFWRPALQRMYAALKPGGAMFFESTNKWSVKSGEFKMPFYGWLPDAARYKLRQIVHGTDIMKLGIDFHQFRYPLLRRAFAETGFSRWYDRVDISDPESIQSQLKKRILHLCKRNRLAKAFVLTFFESTTFVIIK